MQFSVQILCDAEEEANLISISIPTGFILAEDPARIGFLAGIGGGFATGSSVGLAIVLAAGVAAAVAVYYLA